MISAKKLLKLAKKWQKLAAIRRKRITSPNTIASVDSISCSTSTKAEKGCFAVYCADQKRFLLPLEYLNNEIIKELFDMAEEEFGLPSKGPLTFPCDAELMEYAISLANEKSVHPGHFVPRSKCLIKTKVTRDVEQALLTAIASSCSSSFHHLQHQATTHQLPICSF
ncbi:auxin-responsive protein SAUR68 [Ricinus communis]|uniref:Calmodulin binding protein, putative n=1 Tax=Ricinus communis TaxID=3988 RepID=B9S9J9_RICCO|nr:auxin-responsive protein SAUR68 [Ricinus communis]EEF39755.1 calmodulin binding protein, putative [Ricinus communis]|eukprot:XP_025013774.1 auxin-responsive protein SAUR68 [Ricinus communis]